MTKVSEWKSELKKVAKSEDLKILSSFFKTEKGEYGEGDIFIGIRVPDNRKVANNYYNAPLNQIEEMLKDSIHEYRLSALLALVIKFKKTKDEQVRKSILDFYLAHTQYINNWDLVDLSAPYIVGTYLLSHPRDILYTLSQSSNMWEQRIAIVSTLTLIRNDEFDDTLRLATTFLNHKQDLIQKATGWTLREIGKHDIEVLRTFLNANAPRMARTTLRYAIERMDKDEQLHYRSMK